MKNWEDMDSVKKGNFAEKIVHEYLEKKGYVVYKPVTRGNHSFDRFAQNKDDWTVLAVEVKAKARLNKYDETGFDYKHYLRYKRISNKHNMRIFIFFVDEMLKEIYGNFLCILELNSRKAPWGEQILFQMKDMKRNIYKLTDEDVKYLKKHSNRNYDYII